MRYLCSRTIHTLIEKKNTKHKEINCKTFCKIAKIRSPDHKTISDHDYETIELKKKSLDV